jgi:hypothetical protein
VLAAGADRDVSELRAELRAHTQVLNAVRENFAAQGQRSDGLEREKRTGFATMATGMAQITELLTEMRGSEHDG